MELEIYIPDDGHDDFVHRFRNFGEDIYRALRESCSVNIHEIDASIDRFRVREIPKERITEITNIIRQIAHENFFAEVIDLKEVHST